MLRQKVQCVAPSASFIYFPRVFYSSAMILLCTCDVADTNETALHLAAALPNGSVDMVKILFESSRPDARPNTGVFSKVRNSRNFILPNPLSSYTSSVLICDVRLGQL
jgi:hypothetical protein